MSFRKLIEQIFQVGSITMLGRLLSVVLGVMLARLLGAEGYGAYAFAMSLATILALVGRIGLPQFVLREAVTYSERYENERSLFLLHRAAIAIVVCCLLLVVLVGGGTLLLIPQEDLRFVSILIALAVFPFLAMQTLFDCTLRAYQKVSVSRFLTDVLPVAGAILCVLVWIWIASGPVSAATGIFARLVAIAVSVVLMSVLLARLFSHLQVAADGPTYRQMIIASVPFWLSSGANVVLTKTDVILLANMAPLAQTGLYNAAAQAGIFVLIANQAIRLVIVPQFARLHVRDDKAALQALARSGARLSFAAAVLLTVPLVIFSDFFIQTVFGAEFAEAGAIFVVLALGQCVSMAFGLPGFMLNFTGHERLALKLISGAALLNIVLNVILIPFWGAIGAALATVVTQVLWNAVAYWQVRKVAGVRIGAFDIGH